MGARLASAGTAGRYTENAEINVVPFIDVMLVLLIIFMVAAPLSTVNISVDVPSPPVDGSPMPKDPIFISLSKGGEIWLGEKQVSLEGLAEAVMARALGDRETRIMLRADQSIAYGDVVRVMNILQGKGFAKVALVSEEL